MACDLGADVLRSGRSVQLGHHCDIYAGRPTGGYERSSAMKPTLEQTNAWAREVGLFEGSDEVVHAALSLAYEAGRKDENEACAKVAETPVAGEQDDITMEAKDRIAAAIRARREQ